MRPSRSWRSLLVSSAAYGRLDGHLKGRAPHEHERQAGTGAGQRDQRDPAGHRRNRQRAHSAGGIGAVGLARGQRQRHQRGQGQREVAARRHPEPRQKAAAVGTPSAAGVRRYGPVVSAARLHERGARLQPRCGVPVRCRGAQLRQPEDTREVRNAGAAREVAQTPDRGQDAVGLFDDGAAQPGVGSALDYDPCRARWRRVGDQRPQVVHVERARGGLLYRHVPHGRSLGPRWQERQDDADHRAQETPRG